MNDEAARQGRSDNFSNRSQEEYRSLRKEIERLRADIWRALDALEDGDMRLVGELLLAIVEDWPDLQGAA